MIITNLLSNMVLVSGLNVIQANTETFQDYAYHAMFTNAQAVVAAWHLDPIILATNNITYFKASPTIPGIKGGMKFGNRYVFGYEFGRFSSFTDFQNDRAVAHTQNVETNAAIFEQWMHATNLFTMQSATKLAADSMKVINVPGDFSHPKKAQQLKYEWKDGKTYLLPYYGFDWSDKEVHRMEISGIIGKVVYYSAVGASLRLNPPTNYYDLLGLPKDPVFVRRFDTEPPTYEVLFDSKHPDKK